jgi:hypothetical protein
MSESVSGATTGTNDESVLLDPSTAMSKKIEGKVRAALNVEHFVSHQSPFVGCRNRCMSRDDGGMSRSAGRKKGGSLSLLTVECAAVLGRWQPGTSNPCSEGESETEEERQHHRPWDSIRGLTNARPL